MVMCENFRWVNIFRLKNAKSLESTPKSRIKLESLAVILDSLFLLRL